jgi:ferredoxin
MDYLANIIDDARQAGVPMVTVCRAAGIRYSTVWRIKNRRQKPLAETILRLRAALDAVRSQRVR